MISRSRFGYIGFQQIEMAGVEEIVDPWLDARGDTVVGAASVAGLMITTEAMISEKPQKKKGAAMPERDEEMY